MNAFISYRTVPFKNVLVNSKKKSPGAYGTSFLRYNILHTRISIPPTYWTLERERERLLVIRTHVLTYVRTYVYNFIGFNIYPLLTHNIVHTDSQKSNS